jgi:hypothetical protein
LSDQIPEILQHQQEIDDEIRRIFPFVSIRSISEVSNSNLLDRKSVPAMIDRRERVYPFHETGPFSYHTTPLSEALEQCLFLMVRVCCAKPNSIIMIDEPDAHVIPTAQKSLIEFFYRKIESFRQLNSFCQMLITTHSPDILQAVKLENIWQIFLESDSYKPAEIKSLACIGQLYNVLTEVGASFFNSWRISSVGCSSETIILRR